MSNAYTIRIDTDKALRSVNDLAGQLASSQVNKCMSRAINRTLTHERATSRKIVRAKYKMPSDVVDNFHERKSNPTSLLGILSASSKAIPLHRFNPTFITGSYSAKILRNKNGKEITSTKKVKLRSGRAPKYAGLSVTIIKGNKQVLNYAFITKGGAIPVFARGTYAGKGFSFGKARLPISALKTLSLYQAIAGEVSREELNKDSLITYEKNFRHELEYQISKLNKSA